MRTRQRIGYLTGIISLIALLIFFLFPGNERLVSAGPANTGHEALTCSDCHFDAIGTPMQQVNANLRYNLNLRNYPVYFVHRPIEDATCLKCHDRPNDRHPTYRFNEPRFKAARAEIAPQYCASCHMEHSGVRVTQPNAGFCSSCHGDIDLKEDPLDVPHAELAATGEWNSCLACHDFHGNHKYDVPTQLADAYSLEEVLTYFEGGPSPYGDEIFYPAETNQTE